MQPVSKQWLGKHVPAETNTLATIEERCFRCGPRRRVILKAIKLTSSVVSLKSACEEKTRQGRLRSDGAIVELKVDENSDAEYSPESNDTSAQS
jgi:hypothetical protein